MGDLDEFLKGNETIEPEAVETPHPEVPEEPAAEPETPEPEAKAEAQPRGPDGKFVSKGESEPETPAPAASPAAVEPQLDHAALIGERRRRQEAEDRLRALEAQLQQRPQPQQFTAPAQAPDMFEDPEGYTRYISAQAAETARAQAYEQFQYQRIEMAAQQFAPTVPDYAEKVQVFEQMAQANPALMQELYRAANPAEYAYNTAKTQVEINQYGGLEGLIKARVEEALKAQAPAPEPTPAPSVPDTLADAQSARGSSAEPFRMKTLDEILGRPTA